MDPETAVRALGSGAYLRGEMSREEALAAVEYALAHMVSSNLTIGANILPPATRSERSRAALQKKKRWPASDRPF